MSSMNKITCALFALGLTACGGGGGGGSSAPAPSPTPTPDTTSPTISIAGGTSISLNQGDSFTNPSATVTDNRDTGLTAEVSGTVDTSTPGTYTLTYTASDTSGNSRSVDVEVIVNAVDTTSPVIAFAEGRSFSINVGDDFQNPTPTVTDNVDTGLTAEVSGNVDTSVPGEYVLTYSATDTSGNVASIDVTVTVNGNSVPGFTGVPVVFNFNNATTVLTTEEVAIQSGEKVVQQGKGLDSSNDNRRTLNEFVFIPSLNTTNSDDKLKIAKAAVGAKESALFNAGFSEREVIKLARDGATNFFVIDEEGNLEFAADSEYNFKVSYSIIDDDATFIYFAITQDDFYDSSEFIKATGNCAIFKVKLSDGTWSCLADELVAINIDDRYRKTMSDDKRKPIQLDDSGNAYLVARLMNVNDDNADGITDSVDVNYGAEPVLYRISQDGTKRIISPDNVSIQNFVQVNDTTVVYTYEAGGNSGFEMITKLDEESPSTVELGDSGWWNDFFYAIDDSNTVIFSTNDNNNDGISFVQPKANGGVDPYKLDTSAFSSSEWNTTPRRVILADDGGIYGLFEEQVNGNNNTSEVYANLKRILPYSTATFARFKLGDDWWNYFDDGKRNVQISKGYAFYLEDEESRSFGTRTVMKSVRLVDGDTQEFLDGKDESGTWTQRYTVSNWKLSFDTLFFSAFDRAQSKMVQGELDVAAFRDGALESEYLTITETASIVGNDNKIEDLEVLKASRPNVFTGSNPRIVQHYTSTENIYSASVEFNKYMDIDSVNTGTSVTFTNDDDEVIDVGTLKVWLGRRLHLIFDTDISEESLTTDSLDFGSEYKISIDVEAKDLEDFALVSGLAPGSTQDFIEHSFTTRPEVGPFKGSDVIIDGITDGTILKYAAKSTNRLQAEAVLADDVKVLNHRIEFSTPSSMYGAFSLTVTDPYQVNWNGVTHSTSDSDGYVWDWFDGFEINAIGDNATIAAKWNGQVLDTFWGQTLDKKLVADITRGDNGEVLVPIDDADWKTYKRIPYHQIDRDGNRYLQNYSGGVDTITALDIAGTPVYTNRQGHYYDTVTELEYYEYFGDWIANYGTDEAVILTNFDSENIVWKDWGWYDTEGNRFEVNLDGVSDKWVNVDDADDVIDNLYYSFRVDGFPYSDKNTDGFVDISTFAIISGSDTGLFGENMSSEVQGEAAYTWQSDWTGEPTFTADNFEASLDDWRKFLETNFGGWGNNNGRGSQFQLTTQKVGAEYFNFDWENNFEMNLNASVLWVKHVIELTTNADNEVSMTYKIVDAQGNVISNGNDEAEETREIFTDINEASWQYLIDDAEKGGFKLSLSILNGDIAIDNLKVVDISDTANETVILESTFDQGNEGVFQSN